MCWSASDFCKRQTSASVLKTRRSTRSNSILKVCAKGGKYSRTNLQKVFANALKRAHLPSHYTPHDLRHSFATHLIECGVNLRYVQELLGHESSKTTELYFHVAQRKLNAVKSPLDRLDFNIWFINLYICHLPRTRYISGIQNQLPIGYINTVYLSASCSTLK